MKPADGTPRLIDDAVTPARNLACTMRDRFWVIGPIGLVLAFFWQPALRFVAPFVLTSISSLLVIGLVLAARGAGVGNQRVARLFYGCAFILTACGIGEAIYFATLALAVSDANDSRCLSLETHMLAEERARGPNATLFQALGCRPQSRGTVTWPPN